LIFQYQVHIDPTDVSVAQIASGVPDYYLLKNQARAYSGVINEQSFSFGAPVEFATVNIQAAGNAGIIDCKDDNGNTWYEVDYLGQDLVFDGIKNINVNEPN